MRTYAIIAAVCVVIAVITVTVYGLFSNKPGVAPPSNEIVNSVVQDQKPNVKTIGKKVADAHDVMNKVVGWGSYKAFDNKNAPEWKTWTSKDAVSVKDDLDAALAEAKKQSSTKKGALLLKDLNNALGLIDLANKTHNVDALLYLHRIVSDLGEFAYGYKTDKLYFGYTNLLNGSNVKKVDKLLASGG